MTDADNRAVTPSNSMKPKDLPEPHFDQTAVAAAHPVQPLLEERPRRRKHLFFIGLTGLVLIIATLTILGFFIAGRLRSDAAAAPVAEVPSPSPAPAVQSQSDPNVQRAPTVSVPAKPKHLRSSTARSVQAVAIEDQGKPAARRVGVITYGHSRSSRQP